MARCSDRLGGIYRRSNSTFSNFTAALFVILALNCVGLPRLAESTVLALEPVINTEDVARFYALYDATDGKPSAEQVQRDYIDPASAGFHRLAQLRNVTATNIAANLDKNPQMYVDAKRCMVVLPRVRERVDAALHKLGQLYPKAQFPPVTILIGRGKPVGVADSSGVMIDLELLCATNWMNANVEDRFVHVIAHEYVHVQQALRSPIFYDDPAPTVLGESLIEGAADFVGELTSGHVSYTYLEALTKGKERHIETAFVVDEDKTDVSNWLYNSTLSKPADLGYWVGYRIVKSYYQHARDKRVALRKIIEISDPKAFLAMSGWYPGIVLN